ncbi:MAG: FAD-dependent monooxygenase, partial [Caulobacteraceae bacterium]|nr:FAD-dependent monooxygenase [Caulobacter sp.]
MGLALAVGLKLHGIDVAVVDRAAEGRHAPRAAVVWPREAEALAQLGLGSALRAAALPLRTAHVHAGGRRLGGLAFGALESAWPRPLVIEQHALERLLRARLAELGGAVRWETALERWRQDDGGVEAQLSTGERLRAGWLVGCDGAGSQVRKAMGAAFRGRGVRNLECVQGNAHPSWRFDAPPGEGRFFLAPGAVMGCFPTADGWWRFYCFKHDPPPRRQGPPQAAELEALLRRLTGEPVALDAADPEWLNRARFQRRMASAFRRGRVLLCGDAAHVWPAVGGHGMAAGLLGAHNLAWKLAAVVRGEAGARLLDTYAREQRAAARAIMAHMRFDLLEAPQGRTVSAALRLLLPALLRSRPAAAGIEAMLGDMTLHHRASALSRGGGRVRGGDRL